MNGKRILKKLIGLFLIVNVILLLFNHANRNAEYILTRQRVNDIEDVLKNRGITIEAQLPRDFSPKKPAKFTFMGSTVRYEIEKNFFGEHLAQVKHSVGESRVNANSKVQYCTLNDEVLAFKENVLYYENQAITEYGNEISVNEAKAFCEMLIKRVANGKDTSKYSVSAKEQNGMLIVSYYRMFDGIPVAESDMKFKVCEYGVISGTINLVKIEVTGEQSKQIYPIDLVLFDLQDYIMDRENHTISNVELVYRKELDDDSMWGQNIVPAYKIEFKGLEAALYVNAYTNQILK